MAQQAFKYVYPERRLRFQYTTSSSDLQENWGIMKLYITDHDGNDTKSKGWMAGNLWKLFVMRECKSRQSAEAHVHARLAMCM